MDRELTVENIYRRVMTLCKNGKRLTEDSGFNVDYFNFTGNISGDFYSHLRMADYVWIFSDRAGLTLNYMPIHADQSSDDWLLDIDISQVQKFDMPPKEAHENSPATDQSTQG